mmetsp:Transcript_13755/g.21479  ORF Transcript_13755/g.21479 Transcript_13755/m.21479 type:complete len:181 (+) Transcript_13755:155-697(+)
MAELKVKKELKKQEEAAQKVKGSLVAEVAEEEFEEDEESAFAVPMSKPKGAKTKRTVPDDVDEAPEEPAPKQLKTSEAAPVAEIGPEMPPTGDIGPAMPPEGVKLSAPSEDPPQPPAGEPAASNPNPPAPAVGLQGQLSGMMSNRAEIEDMLIDDPDNEDLLAMIAQVDSAIAAIKTHIK